jgi:hypothetical protein
MPPKRRKRPQVVTVSGNNWQRKPPQYARAVYKPGCGKAPEEQYKLEKFADKALYEKLISDGGAGTLMQSMCDLAPGWHAELDDGTRVLILNKNHLYYSSYTPGQSIQLPKGSFFAGQLAIFVRKVRTRTPYVIDDTKPVFIDRCLFIIDGDMYAIDDLSHFVQVPGA